MSCLIQTTVIYAQTDRAGSIEEEVGKLYRDACEAHCQVRRGATRTDEDSALTDPISQRPAPVRAS